MVVVFLSFYQSYRRRDARKADPQPAHSPISSIWFLSRLFFVNLYCKIKNHTLIVVNMHYVFYCLLYYKDIAYMLRDPKNSIASWPHPWFLKSVDPPSVRGFCLYRYNHKINIAANSASQGFFLHIFILCRVFISDFPWRVYDTIGVF